MSFEGWVYGDVENAKEEIKVAVDGERKKYLPIWKIIDKKCDDKLKAPYKDSVTI